MKNKLSAIGMTVGLIWLCISIVWFGFIFQDNDKLITNILIGIAFTGVWYNHKCRIQSKEETEERLEKIDKDLDNLLNDLANYQQEDSK